jgi:uncharacterized coiled-coil DUF342 family protein
MKIISVHFSKLVNTGEYENEKLGATAEVDWDLETPEQCQEKLIEWVESGLNERDALRESTVPLRAQVYNLTNRKDEIEGQIERAQEKLALMRSLAKETNALMASLEGIPF